MQITRRRKFILWIGAFVFCLFLLCPPYSFGGWPASGWEWRRSDFAYYRDRALYWQVVTPFLLATVVAGAVLFVTAPNTDPEPREVESLPSRYSNP